AGRVALFALEPGERIVDRDVLYEAGGLLAGRDLQNSIQRQVELDDELVPGRDAGEAIDEEHTDAVVSTDILTFALVDVDLDGRLVVGNGSEDFGPRRGERCAAPDDRSKPEFEPPAKEVIAGRRVESLDSERVRGDVHEHGPDRLAGDHGCLNRRPERDAQIRVDVLARRATEAGFEELGNERRPRAAADRAGSG